MPATRPYVISIAGFDPSGGAGLLADIKTFEQHGVYGLAVNTANTIQTGHAFHAVNWASQMCIRDSHRAAVHAPVIGGTGRHGLLPKSWFRKSRERLHHQA